jgi:hypothetical protein
MVEVPKITESLIDDRRRRFAAGDKAALLDAIDLCARAGLPMPGWLAEAYCDAMPSGPPTGCGHSTRRSAWTAKAGNWLRYKNANH